MATAQFDRPSSYRDLSNHHDGELSPPMMKGACGGVSGRVPVRETSSEAAVLSLAYFLTPFTVI